MSVWKKVAIPVACCLALTAGALLLQAQTGIGISDLQIRFSDGTVQQTAAHNCVNPADPADEMIRIGGICIDTYEASIWSSPTGGTQYGVAGDDYPCSDNGQDCNNIYARSVEGEQPSAFVTWFQAQAALANSGKRLPSNAEWQMAVRGTPDSSLCNVANAIPGPATTGFFVNCVSDFEAFDMVGNLWEWVADWDEVAADCESWSSTFGDDLTCIGRGEGDTEHHFPGALFRGGHWSLGADAGPFAVSSNGQPSGSADFLGVRGAR